MQFQATLQLLVTFQGVHMDTTSLDSVPVDVQRLMVPLLDGTSWASLCQVSRGFSELSQHDIDIRIVNFVLDKFSDLICDIRDFVHVAETYTEVAERCKTMVKDAMDPGMAYGVRMSAYSRLFDRVLGRATDTIAYSEYCKLEGSGSKDYFRIWRLVAAAVY